MAEEKNFFQVWAEEAPGTSKAFFDMAGALMGAGGLDEKTWQLIYIGIQASRSFVDSVCGHTAFAKKAGATREEVRDAILISLMVSGIQGVSTCLIKALEAYDNAEG